MVSQDSSIGKWREKLPQFQFKLDFQLLLSVAAMLIGGVIGWDNLKADMRVTQLSMEHVAVEVRELKVKVERYREQQLKDQSWIDERKRAVERAKTNGKN